MYILLTLALFQEKVVTSLTNKGKRKARTKGEWHMVVILQYGPYPF